MDALDNRLTWTTAAGVELGNDTAAANGVTYYAEIPVKGARQFAVSIKHDATEASTFTLESGNDPTITHYAAAATGWTSQATALGTLTAAASASTQEWQVSGAESSRWRVKRVVVTGGVVTARATIKVG